MTTLGAAEGGALAIGLALVLLVVALRPAGAKEGGIPGALAVIEKRYTRSEEVGEEQPKASGLAIPSVFLRLGRRLSPAGVNTKLQRRLDLAGNPSGWNPDRILATKGLGLVGVALFGGFFGFQGLHSPLMGLLLAVGGGAFGFFLGDLLVYNTGTKRQEKIQLLLPDSLDMLTVCVEAGLAFDAALIQVAQNTTGPVAAEFGRMLQEMQIGKSRAQALRSMGDRSTVPELRTFVTALVQASELGLPMGQVLREQAKEMRTRRRQRAEEKAQQLPVKILFPLIVCLFPALMIVVVGPGAINIAHSLFAVHG
jgi:tight adherence protein C